MMAFPLPQTGGVLETAASPQSLQRNLELMPPDALETQWRRDRWHPVYF